MDPLEEIEKSYQPTYDAEYCAKAKIDLLDNIPSNLSEWDCIELIFHDHSFRKYEKGLHKKSSGIYCKEEYSPYRIELMRREKLCADKNQFELRHITFSGDPAKVSKWSEGIWESKLRKVLLNTKSFGYKGVLEHHKDGKIHCHLITVVDRKNITQYGYNKAYFERYWKVGNIKVTKPDLKKNPNSIRDMINYLDKEVGATQFYENWNECLALLE